MRVTHLVKHYKTFLHKIMDASSARQQNVVFPFHSGRTLGEARFHGEIRSVEPISPLIMKGLRYCCGSPLGVRVEAFCVVEHRPGARASRPHPVPLAAAELPCDAVASHPVCGNGVDQAAGEPWRRSRLIQVEEMAEAVPGFVRARRPRSQEAFIP